MLSFLASLVSTKDEIVDMLVSAALVAPNIEIYIPSRLSSMFGVSSRAHKHETLALVAQYANLAAPQAVVIVAVVVVFFPLAFAVVIEKLCCEEKCSQWTCQPQFYASDLAEQVTGGMINCCR